MSHQYKVGDLVLVLPRIGESGNYRFGYTSEMRSFEGRTLRIKNISDASPSSRQYARPDDGKCYTLEGNTYSWASSMFELCEQHPILKVGDVFKILPRNDDPSFYTNSYVDSMLKFVGETTVITEAILQPKEYRRRDDGYAYHLEIDNGSWNWSSNALLKVASIESVKKPSLWESPPKPEAEGRFEKVEYPPGYFSSKKQESYKLDFNI